MVYTAGLVIVRGIIDCIEWLHYLRQWHGYIDGDIWLARLRERSCQSWWDHPRKLSSSVPSATPRVLWSWRSKKMKGFRAGHDSWGLALHLMHGSSTTCVVATWRVLISGVNTSIVWPLGFPLIFSFCVLVFKLPFFSIPPSLFPIS